MPRWRENIICGNPLSGMVAQAKWTKPQSSIVCPLLRPDLPPYLLTLLVLVIWIGWLHHAQKEIVTGGIYCKEWGPKVGMDLLRERYPISLFYFYLLLKMKSNRPILYGCQLYSTVGLTSGCHSLLLLSIQHLLVLTPPASASVQNSLLTLFRKMILLCLSLNGVAIENCFQDWGVIKPVTYFCYPRYYISIPYLHSLPLARTALTMIMFFFQMRFWTMSLYI